MDGVLVSEETRRVRRGTDNKEAAAAMVAFHGLTCASFQDFCVESLFTGRAVTQVISKMRPLWGALIQGDCYPNKKQKFGHRDRGTTICRHRETTCPHLGLGLPSLGQGFRHFYRLRRWMSGPVMAVPANSHRPAFWLGLSPVHLGMLFYLLLSWGSHITQLCLISEPTLAPFLAHSSWPPGP